jgi:hypothetical protein
MTDTTSKTDRERVAPEEGIGQRLPSGAEPWSPAAQGRAARPPTQERPAAPWVVRLLIAALADMNYTFRTRLLKLISNDTAQATRTAERKVLYWVDPVHPRFCLSNF